MNKETNDKIKMVTLGRGDRDLLRNSGLLFLRELCARSLLENKEVERIKKEAKAHKIRTLIYSLLEAFMNLYSITKGCYPCRED